MLAIVVAMLVGASACMARSGSVHHSGELIWNGDLPGGSLSQWWYVQACRGPSPPAGVRVVRRPVHAGWHYSLRFDVGDGSVNANCPILGSPGNPNAQVLSPNMFRPGMNVYIGVSIFLPPHFPSLCTPFRPGCFFSFLEIYGEPFGGSPPFALTGNGRHFSIGSRTSPDAWNSPRWVRGRWADFVFHVNFATDDSGYIELWYDGVRQRFRNGSDRLHGATLVPGINWNGSTPDHLSLQSYRSASPAMGNVVSYMTGARVGTSYASVAP